MSSWASGGIGMQRLTLTAPLRIKIIPSHNTAKLGKNHVTIQADNRQAFLGNVGEANGR